MLLRKLAIDWLGPSRAVGTNAAITSKKQTLGMIMWSILRKPEIHLPRITKLFTPKRQALISKGREKALGTRLRSMLKMNQLQTTSENFETPFRRNADTIWKTKSNTWGCQAETEVFIFCRFHVIQDNARPKWHYFVRFLNCTGLVWTGSEKALPWMTSHWRNLGNVILT